MPKPLSNRYGEILPDVFIGDIKIAPNFSSIEQREGDSYKVTEYEPYGQTDRSFEADSQLKVTVKLYLKEIINTKTKKAFWYNKGGIFNKLKLRVVQSISSTSTDEIKKTPFELFPGGRLDTIALNKEKGAFTNIITKDIKVNDQLSRKLKHYRSSKHRNYNLYDIPFEVSFNIPNSNINHLSYFAACYFDTEQGRLVNEKVYNKKLLSSVQGKFSSEIVIQNGNVVKNSSYYATADGVPWYGPIHQRGSGVVYTGIKRGIGPTEQLQSISVPNYKVRDYRVLKTYKQLPVDFKDYDLTEKNDEIYFTDMYLNQEKSGTSKFIFGVDLLKTFRKNSMYSKIFKNLDTGIGKKVMASSMIRSLKIYRTRIENKLNGMGDFNIKKEKQFKYLDGGLDWSWSNGGMNKHLVVEMYNQNLSSLISGKDMSATNSDIDTGEMLGHISLINLSADNSSDVIYFQCIDSQLSKVDNGTYQYSIEMEIEDRTAAYLKSKISSLKEGMRYYQAYLNLARQVGYNPNNKKFSKSFIKTINIMKKDYDNKFAWDLLLKNFFKNLNLFLGHNPKLTSGLQNDLARLLYSMASPETAEPQEIEHVLNIVMDFIKNVDKKISIKNELETLNDRFGGIYSNSEKETLFNSFIIKNTFGIPLDGVSNKNRGGGVFSSFVDASAKKDFGYEYFDVKTKRKKEDEKLRFKTVTKRQFEARAKNEVLKYFKSENPSLNIKIDGVSYSDNDTVVENKYRYFSPSTVSLGNDRQVSMTEGQGKIANQERSSNLLMDVMAYHAGSETDESMNNSDESLDNKLDSYLFFRDLSRENNIVSDVSDNFLNNNITSYIPMADYVGVKSKLVISENCRDNEELVQKINREKIDEKFKPTSGENKDLRIEEKTPGTRLGLALLGTNKLKTLEPAKNIKNWDLRSPINVTTFIDNLKSRKTLSEESRSRTIPEERMVEKSKVEISREKKEIIKELPNQIKSLMYNGVRNISNINLKTPKGQKDHDPLQDANKFADFWINHGQLAEVQVYMGQKIINNEASLREPTWIPMSQAVWNNVKNKGNILARLVPHKNEEFFGTNPEIFELPIQNEYFIIQGSSQKGASDKKISNKNTEALDKYLTNLNTAVSNGVSPEYISNDVIPYERKSIGSRIKQQSSVSLVRMAKLDRFKGEPKVTVPAGSMSSGGGSGGSGTGGY